MAQKGKKKAIKSMEKLLKTPKKVKKVVETAAEYVNKTHWDTKEAFASAIDAISLSSVETKI